MTITIEGEHLKVSDGFHTFDELYEHRISLYIALCRTLEHYRAAQVWRSRLHSDGSAFQGWFVLGIGVAQGEQITYHVPWSRWEETDFATERDRAPEWDGHTAAHALLRLQELP